MTQQLNVKNLVVDLQTESGMARAVDALNLTLQKAKHLHWSANRVAVNP